MTVAAINAFVCYVVLVEELYGLIPGNALVPDVRRARHDEYAGQRQTSQNDGSEQTKPRQKIRTTVKDLCHVSIALGQNDSPEGSYSRENLPLLCRTAQGQAETPG
jgi:hypothetical protein